MEKAPVFRGAFLDEVGFIDTEVVEAEVTAVARSLVEDHPEVGAILLECSNLPPYAHAVHRATGRPVFDFITLANWVASAVLQKTYTGWF